MVQDIIFTHPHLTFLLEMRYDLSKIIKEMTTDIFNIFLHKGGTPYTLGKPPRLRIVLEHNSITQLAITVIYKSVL